MKKENKRKIVIKSVFGKKTIKMSIAKFSIIAFVFLVFSSLIVFSERLPIVGSDNDAWGTIWNRLWNVSHYENGTLRHGINGTFWELNASNFLRVRTNPVNSTDEILEFFTDFYFNKTQIGTIISLISYVNQSQLVAEDLMNSTILANIEYVNQSQLNALDEINSSMLATIEYVNQSQLNALDEINSSMLATIEYVNQSQLGDYINQTILADFNTTLLRNGTNADFGRVIIGTSAPDIYPFDITHGDDFIGLSTMRMQTNVNASIDKYSTLGSMGYYGENYPDVLLFVGYLSETINTMNWGGTSPIAYTVTEHKFYTAPNSTYHTGNLSIYINNNGTTIYRNLTVENLTASTSITTRNLLATNITLNEQKDVLPSYACRTGTIVANDTQISYCNSTGGWVRASLASW